MAWTELRRKDVSASARRRRMKQDVSKRVRVKRMREERDIQALTTPGLATVVQKIDFMHGRSEEIEGRGQAQGKKDVWETVGDVLDILEGVRRVCPYLVFSASERVGRN